MMNLPNDPAMLLSFLNTKLRDEYDSLSSLCGEAGIPTEELLLRLKDLGLCYNEERNRVELV